MAQRAAQGGLELRYDAAGDCPALLASRGRATITLHSRRDPVGEADRLLGEALPPDGAIVVIGLGLGYLLDALEARRWPGRVIAVDPGAEFEPFRRKRREWSRWDGRLATFIATPEDGVRDLWQQFHGLAEEPPVFVNPAVERLVPVHVAAARKSIRAAWFEHQANEAARRMHAGRYRQNTLLNRARIAAAPGTRVLEGGFPGMPAVVVAAGPSLDRNIPAIAAHAGRALIVAVDTALRPLLAHGIHPHLVVAIDPSEANARHLCDLPPCPRSWLVAEGSLDPAGLEHFSDRVIFCRIGEHAPWPSLCEEGIDPGTLGAFGSVLTTAFDLALRMGCNPITFAGADLAFTGGRPYARLTTSEWDWRCEMRWGTSIETIWRNQIDAWPALFETGLEGTVRTAPHLRAFRDWIVRRAADAVDRTILNGTGAGILTGDSVRQVVLSDTLAALPPLPGDPADAIAMLAGPSRIAQSGPPSTAAVRRDIALPPEEPDGAEEHSTRLVAVLEQIPTHLRALAGRLRAEDQAIVCDAIAGAGSAWRLVGPDSPWEPMSPRVMDAFDGLDGPGVVIVIDPDGTAAAARLRRAVADLLCGRAFASLHYQRFTDPLSCVAIVRRHADEPAAPSGPVDAAKWEAAQASTASRLAPFIVHALRPRSVIDLGCGKGHWLLALARAGVESCTGVTPSQEGEPLDGADVRRGPLLPGTGLPRADACLCLEVVQNLSRAAQRDVVAMCVEASDTVVFSSATPGARGSSPLARPLGYWAELFLEHGYAFDDPIRPLIEQACGMPQALADLMVVFRRSAALSSASDEIRADVLRQQRALAARVQDLYLQTVWLQHETPPAPPGLRLGVVPDPVWWNVPPHRVMPGPAGAHHVRFVSDSAAWYVTHPATRLDVRVNGRLLRTTGSTVAECGVWRLERDVLVITMPDGRDLRANGERVEVRLPRDVAAAENLGAR